MSHVSSPSSADSRSRRRASLHEAPSPRSDRSKTHAKPGDRKASKSVIDDHETHAESHCNEDPAATMDGENATCDADVIVGDIIRQLHTGELNANELPTDVRRACVRHMTDEGYTAFDIAAALQVTDRTVHRDRAALRQANAVAPTLELGDELLGEMQRVTYNAIQKLTRLASNHDTPAFARLWASEAMSRVFERFIKMAQSMEYIQTGRGRLRRLNEQQPGFDPLAGPATNVELDVLRRLMKVG